MAQFDWDKANRNHLQRHDVTTKEFEQAMLNDPLELGWEDVDGEERYHAAGMTNSGRLLYMVWTSRDGAIRAVTAFTAPYRAKQAWKKRQQ